MQLTTNYKFKKPQDDDFFDVRDFADMMDGVDTQLKKQEDSTKNVVADAKKEAETAANNILGNKADKSTILTATVLKGAWTGTEAPFVNNITVHGLKGGDNELVEILVPYSATVAQKLAWAEAGILSGDNVTNGIIIQAFGEKPEIDIPLQIIKRGDGL